VVGSAPVSAARRMVTKVFLLGLRATLVFSCKPTVWAVRAPFKKDAAGRAARQPAAAPADIVAVIDER
jgi:hypothetical protein